MFGSDKKKIFSEKRKDTERSLISETVSIDGAVNSSGSISLCFLTALQHALANVKVLVGQPI